MTKKTDLGRGLPTSATHEQRSAETIHPLLLMAPKHPASGDPPDAQSRTKLDTRSPGKPPAA
jgi:hypothetical protein